MGDNGEQLPPCDIEPTLIALHEVRENYWNAALRVIFLLQLSVATVGNLMCLLVLLHSAFQQRRGRRGSVGHVASSSSTSRRIYLGALALTDMLFIWAQTPTYLITHFGEELGGERSTFHRSYQSTYGITVFLNETFSLSSDLILTAFLIERCNAARFPMRSVVSSAKPARYAVIAIVLFAALHSSVSIVDYYWFLAQDPNAPPPMRPNWLELWTAEKSLIHYLIAPTVLFLVLFIGNLLIIRHMIFSHRFRRNFPHHQSSNHVQTFTYILIGCVALYSVTHTPVFVLNLRDILSRFFTEMRPNICHAEFLVFWLPLKEALTNFNYSLNFLLYTCLSATFREELRAFLASLNAACGCSGSDGHAVAGRQRSISVEVEMD